MFLKCLSTTTDIWFCSDEQDGRRAKNRKPWNDNFYYTFRPISIKHHKNVCSDDILIQVNKDHVESDHETQVSDLFIY